MTHKRTTSKDEAPPAKRQQTTSAKPGEFASQPQIHDQYVYIVTEEVYGPYFEIEQPLFEAYATLENANRKVPVRQKELLDPDDWENQYDTFDCCQSKSIEGEGEGWNINVRRYLLRPPGSVPISALIEEKSPESEESQADIVTMGQENNHGPEKCRDPNCGNLACAG
ncbi:MAG: hypothetical protein L6R41_001830 [Letrouitia leprolyta]|nr:MAG: hypothetical protein L6R41_001830 [Letrouitia leprolyta]